MKLWTDKEIQLVESEVAKLNTWTESYKNYREIKIKPQQLVDQLVLIGQAFDEIKHYKSQVEEMQKALEWYANGWNYVIGSDFKISVIEDDGERARQALKGESL